MKLHVLGIDLGKTVFHLVGLDSSVNNSQQFQALNPPGSQGNVDQEISFFNFGGGPGRVAIHGRDGTSLADPLGSSASHGCVRVDDVNIIWMAHVIPLGTPVLII